MVQSCFVAGRIGPGLPDFRSMSEIALFWQRS